MRYLLLNGEIKLTCLFIKTFNNVPKQECYFAITKFLLQCIYKYYQSRLRPII